MQIPITFEGRDSLDNLLLQVYKSEVDVLGKLTMMPEAIVVDVSTMLLGDTITSKNFKLDAQLKITESENEVYGIITLLPVLVEEPEIVVAKETSTTVETK
ncbi:fragment of 50S ribosomal subunit protein L25 (C-terminal part) [Candidatus Desulfosporosinus infrequens]|uniref:Fragment of 50S ribosomal subunit protein L25 (C-terminal part) n=1 Tax=Candidatus Desulfosporosinus infrequens TaxID=2043169 RepID=A0A2U3K5V3_9FIRM|nr:fragment of 50S ribosomal subunit protein L25 (C-terminal part) [Candidatus Desulfosporosinus infrequens]